jgi:hypothetical protein
MILYYAVGGGLGHLTRARRVLSLLRIDAAVVTASPHAALIGLPIVTVPPSLSRAPEEHRAWMRTLRCERLIVDTFPGGIQGELCGLDMPMDYVARLLRWEEYRKCVPQDLPRFGTTWVVEELTDAHAAFVRANSHHFAQLDVGAGFSPPVSRPAEAARYTRYWLIVHSGPEDEVRELVAYAQELRPTVPVLVATARDVELPRGFERIDIYPASALFPKAERIISAAGFNVMCETEAWRAKHHVLPFPRRFDHQYLRAARRRLLTAVSS